MAKLKTYVFQVGRSGGRIVRITAVSRFAAKKEIDNIPGITPKTERKLVKVLG